jgi:hypothetical protein
MILVRRAFLGRQFLGPRKQIIPKVERRLHGSSNL